MAPRCCLCKRAKVVGNGSFFATPKDDRRRDKWIEICKIQFSKHSLICEDHFLSSDIIQRGKLNSLMPAAVPFVQPLLESNNQNSLHKSSFPNFTLNPNLRICNSYRNSLDFPLQTARFPDDQNQIDMYNLPEEYFNVSMKTTVCNDSQTQTDVSMKTTVYSDAQTQTDPQVLKKAEDYRQKIKSLEEENKTLKLNLAGNNAAVESMKSILTEGQIRKMMKQSNVQWSWSDISSAICLHASGPRAYNHLYKKGFPLPHVSTLQRWSRKVNVDEGFLDTSLGFMKENTKLSMEEKICVLAFDEMKVEETFEYEAVGDFVRKPANYVQVVIARGLKKSWKQPIFYKFDCEMTKEIIFFIIKQLYQAGFPVVAIVCDMGPTNRKLWKELGVDKDKPWFPNPLNCSEKVFTFADAPHLLKLIRNHFLDNGLVYKNEILTSRTIVDLINYTSTSDISIIFKLTDEHLTVKGAGRQKVKMPSQLFSNTTANAITRCSKNGLVLYNATGTAEFIQLVNDWFDIMNSSMKLFGYPGKQPFGIDLANQQRVLTQMNEVMSSPIIPDKNTLECFQKGILMSNNALQMLYDYTKEKYNMTFILTYRLNQDIIENFFGNMRSSGGLNDHPTPKAFKYRIRKYILARNTEHLHSTGNVDQDTTDWMGSKVPLTIKSFTQNVTDMCAEDSEDKETPDPEILQDLCTDDGDILRDDALENLSGYIIRKCNLEEYECRENTTFTWVDQVSKGFLKKPSSAMVSCIKKLELVFHELNKTDISFGKNLQQRLMKRSSGIELPEKAKKFFFKCRTHFRVKHLNKRLKVQKAKQRIMGCSKMFKIKL